MAVPFTIAPTQFAPDVQKLDFYSENLQDLAQRNVILYDTQSCRGWLLNAERVALQIVLHRQEAGRYDKLVDLVLPGARDDIRSAMTANGPKILKKDIDLGSLEEKKIIFALEVKKI